MRIAVVGATGMIGRHVVREALGCGHGVIAVSRAGGGGGGRVGGDVEEVEERRADLADKGSLRAALAGADAVIHCAGYYPGAPRPLAEEMERAGELTANFYDVCATLALGRIVYVGAAIVIPKRRDGEPSDGQASFEGRPRDSNPYLQVKWLQDRAAREWAGRGLPVVIGVPAMTFGEFDPGNSTGRFVLEMANGTLPGYVEGRRNVVYAGDAARGLVRAAEDGVPGRRYLLTGENLTMGELMAKIAEVTGSAGPKVIPLGVARALSAWQGLRYRLMGGPVPKISETAIAVMASGQFLEGAVAGRELGYVPAVSVEEAIRRTYAWFVAQGMIAGRRA